MILIPAIVVAVAIAEVVFHEFLSILKMKYKMMLMMMIRIFQDGQQELDRSQNGWRTLYAAS